LNKPTKDAPSVKSKSNKTGTIILIISIAILLLIGIITGCYFYTKAKRQSDLFKSTVYNSIPPASSPTADVTPIPANSEEANVGASSNASPSKSNCTKDDYAMEESICSSQTPEKVCGTIKYIYDNDQTSTQSTTFNNVCEFCSQFESDGTTILRGTKLMAIGYSMGGCK
jgi:cell division protein FtsN